MILGGVFRCHSIYLLPKLWLLHFSIRVFATVQECQGSSFDMEMTFFLYGTLES